MPNAWYLHRAGIQHGPYPEEAFRDLVRNGQLQSDDLIWFEGAQDWISGASFLSSEPPPEPDLSKFGVPTSHTSASSQKRKLNRYIFLPLFVLIVMVGLAMLEPASIPYRLAGGINGAIFGGVAGGLAALIQFAIRKTLTALPITVAAVFGFVASQSVEHSINFVGAGFYDRTVKPRVTQHLVASELDKYPIFQLLAEVDAAAYQELRTEVAKRTAAGASGSEVGTFSQAYVANFRRVNAHHVIAAPAAFLEDLMRSTHAITSYLQKRDVALCRAFVLESLASQKLRTLTSDPLFSTLLTDNAAVLFKAIAAGKKSPTTYSPLGDPDVELAAQQLNAKGWTDEMRLALAEPERLRAMPAEQACQLQLEWLEALSLLPAGPRARWHREILAVMVKG